MDRNKTFDDDYSDSTEEIENAKHVRNIPRPRGAARSKPKPHRAQPLPPPMAPLPAAADEEEQFQMTYRASRYEAVWLESSLVEFYRHKWFDDVLRMVKGGKEASVYLCEGNETTGEDFLAAKVYRPRMFRNLRNDWLYRENRTNMDDSGREIRNKGMLHAIHKRTEYGRELLHTAWLVHEYETLRLLHAAGADVPKPYASDSNTVLMSYLGDEVMGAPTLHEVSLPAREARALFDRVIHNIDLMLSLGRIHGDLSAFNILYWEGEIALIDFPQAVNPEENTSSFRIFERDVTRVCEYFTRQGIRSDGRRLASEIWRRHQKNFIPPADPHIIGEDNEDRSLWESFKNK